MGSKFCKEKHDWLEKGPTFSEIQGYLPCTWKESEVAGKAYMIVVSTIHMM